MRLQRGRCGLNLAGWHCNVRRHTLLIGGTLDKSAACAAESPDLNFKRLVQYNTAAPAPATSFD